MRYRALSPTGDFQFGRGGVFLVNSPAAVAQAVATRLALWAGEWFLDADEGTPYLQRILGHGAQAGRDLAIRARILSTPGVSSIVSYKSSVTGDRRMVVSVELETDYGSSTVEATLG
jgi:hypothetical protein